MLLALEATDKSEKPKNTLSYSAMTITFLVSAIIGIFEYVDMYQLISRILTFVFLFFGLLIWCFANGNNPHLQTINHDSASGGDTAKGLKGNTEGFQE